MSYQVLALKWRPQVFEDVVGQETITRTLKNAIQQDRIAHAFLFSGVRGVGKTSTARILAKALNCASGPTVEPCGQCPACREIAASSSLDVLEIDAASNTKVEQVRELIEASRYAPSRDRFKIYIIDEVHMLSDASFNALLKTLEEPPPRVKFIFATTEYHKIPDTILSRCQQFDFRTVASREIAARLRRIAGAEGIEISEAALGQIARAAEGSLRDALSSLDQILAASGARITEKDVVELLGLIDRQVLAAAAEAITRRETAEILRLVDRLVRGGRDLRSFALGLMQYFRDALVVRAAPEATELVELAADPGENARLKEIAGQLSEEDLLRIFDVLTQLEGALRWSPEPRFHLEAALLKLSQLQRLASFEELLARFEALERGRPSQEKASPETTGGGGALARHAAAAGAGSEGGASPAESLQAPLVRADPAPVSPEQILARVLERTGTVKPKLFGLLSHHNGMSLEGDRLRIGFAPAQALLREELEQDDCRRLLEQIASEVAGQPLRVEIEWREQGAGATSPGAGPDPDSPRQSALEEPLVRAFLETFQGEIEEIEGRGESLPTRSAEGPGER